MGVARYRLLLCSPDATAPDLLVEPVVDAHVLGAHLLHGKLADLLEGAGGLLLGADAVQPLVEVDRVVTSDHLRHGRLGLLLPVLGLGHLQIKQTTEHGEKTTRCRIVYKRIS